LADSDIIRFHAFVLEPRSVLHIIRPILLLLASMSLVPTLAQAGAVLFIYPTLVIFEGGERSGTVTVTNRGDQTGTFEMSWTNMTMTPSGGLVKNEGPAPWSIEPYVRFSPRRVTLAPLESQVIRIAVRRGLDVPEGEYFSHFRVLTLNSEDPSAAEEDTSEQVATAVVIAARSAVAIPIVWRNSRDNSSASIESVRIDRDSNQLSVDVMRHGQVSVRGFLHVFETAADGARSSLAEPVALVIYPNLDARTMTIELNDGVTAGSLKRGTEVYYSTDLEMSDRSIVIASYALDP
jgi:P pilus assembly chaperone PapD